MAGLGHFTEVSATPVLPNTKSLFLTPNCQNQKEDGKLCRRGPLCMYPLSFGAYPIAMILLKSHCHLSSQSIASLSSEVGIGDQNHESF